MYKNIVLLYCLCMLFINSISAQQYKSIPIEQAIELALKQDPSMILADLYITQSDVLSTGGVPMQPAQIFFSGDEFNFDGISGIQSLNIQQSFNLPSVSKTYQDYNKAQSKRYKHQKLLTTKDIVRNVESSYYNLAIAKQELILSQDAMSIYSSFLTRSKDAYEGGESNKVAMITARTLLKKATLNTDHAAHEVEVAREIFNIWLGKTDNYDTEILASDILEDFDKKEEGINPHLGIYQLEKEVIERGIEMQKSKLLPQLNTGLRLQSVNGDLLYFGYQLGVNIPLMKGGYKKQIEGSKVSLAIVDTEKKIKEREIVVRTTKLKNHIEHLKLKIKAYDTDLLPSISEQLSLLKDAYQAGEGSYIEYMMSIENYNDLQLEKLNLIEDFYKNHIELKYWTEVY